jgi:hypothetical protein
VVGTAVNAEMRHQLSSTLGVRWRPGRKAGTWEIDGINDGVLWEAAGIEPAMGSAAPRRAPRSPGTSPTMTPRKHDRAASTGEGLRERESDSASRPRDHGNLAGSQLHAEPPSLDFPKVLA